MDVESPHTNWPNVVSRRSDGVIYARATRRQPEKCRKKNYVAKSVSEIKNDNMHEVKKSFVFKVGINVASKQNVNGLLVDCGETTHIVNDLTLKFIRFDIRNLIMKIII